MLWSPPCDPAEVCLWRRPHPCSALPAASPAPLTTPESPPSINHMHQNPHLRLCFQGNRPKASYTFSYLFTNLTWNSPSWILESPVRCANVWVCFAQDKNTWMSSSWVTLAGYTVILHQPSVPKASSTWACHDWRGPVSGKRKIPQFILQYGSARLGSSSRASWERNAWGLSLLLRVPRDNSQIIYCDICLHILYPSEAMQS